MDRKDLDWKLENEWLQKVLKEAQKQLDKNRGIQAESRKDAIKTQREMWEDIGVVSSDSGLEHIADFMSYINTMRMQKRSHEFTRRQVQKYERVLDSPYFGRIDFKEEGEEEPEKYYIGISSLVDDDNNILVYDWRAPVSSMFYDWEIGEASYECPEGTIHGEITLKRQYKISKGKMEYMFDSSLKIDDEILQDILSKSTDTKMKAIVTTIQREQNRVIRNEDYKYLIVQGPAGSGKTSVALHRIAYLLYKHRDKIGPQHIVIFSPNEIFNDYISNVLPELGEENMYQTTFKDYMHQALGGELKKESYGDMMEYILGSRHQPAYHRRINSIQFKSSKAFMDILKRYVAWLDKEDRAFKDIVFRGRLIISAEELRVLFFKDYAHLPLKRRLERIRNRIFYLLEPYEKQRIEEVSTELEVKEASMTRGEIRERSAAIVQTEERDMYDEIDRVTGFDLIDIYKELFERLESFYPASDAGDWGPEEIEDIKGYTLENLNVGMLYYEDQPPFLYLKGALGDLPKISDIKHVIVDEAQDYTSLQYEVFLQLFEHANMTILGDLHQAINPYMNLGGYEHISHLFPKDQSLLIHLTKSYRSTMEITRFSRRLLGKLDEAGWIERRGEEPLVLGFPDEGAIHERLVEDIKKYKEKGYQSIAVITRTVKEAEKVYSFLKDQVHIHAILKDDDEYVGGILVIPSYLAKGLEFDVVLIYNAGDDNYSVEEERLLFYTACTRALHVLCIYYSGEPTPLLKNSGADRISS
ncbi:MAG: RNA polymerase recycling motor HelD [Clostridia bacterium]|jgi:DNA helicase-2/ATP-dependent DNA helicase PcrA